MSFEEAYDAYVLHSISPELTCSCDEFHICQQCHEEMKAEAERNHREYNINPNSNEDN